MSPTLQPSAGSSPAYRWNHGRASSLSGQSQQEAIGGERAEELQGWA